MFTCGVARSCKFQSFSIRSWVQCCLQGKLRPQFRRNNIKLSLHPIWIVVRRQIVPWLASFKTCIRIRVCNSSTHLLQPTVRSTDSGFANVIITYYYAVVQFAGCTSLGLMKTSVFCAKLWPVRSSTQILTEFLVYIEVVWHECEQCLLLHHRGVHRGFEHCCESRSPETGQGRIWSTNRISLSSSPVPPLILRESFPAAAPIAASHVARWDQGPADQPSRHEHHNGFDTQQMSPKEIHDIPDVCGNLDIAWHKEMWIKGCLEKVGSLFQFLGF